MSKKTWLVEPHDSLIVRDGRPFGATGGSRAKSLDFPFPSTLIGSVRTRIGLANGGDWSGFSKELINQIQQIEMFGPILSEIKDNQSLKLFAPSPADALFVNLEKEDEKDITKSNLFPLIPLAKGYQSNLPGDLHLLGIEEEFKGKPNSDVRFWHWGRLEKWLIKASPDRTTSEDLGIGGLVSDQRTHVKIFDEEERQKGKDGYWRKANSIGGLFQTRGLEFSTKDRKRLALALQLSDSKGLEEGLFPLGGERRIVRWSSNAFDFPQCPPKVTEGIKDNQGHCRLILLTPAYFENGFLPKDMNSQIKAVAVNRPQVISGWDFDKKKPKPTRRLTPAGTVYFLKIDGDIEASIDKVWFKKVGDCDQTRRDGFGLAVLGNWDGEFHSI